MGITRANKDVVFGQYLEDGKYYNVLLLQSSCCFIQRSGYNGNGRFLSGKKLQTSLDQAGKMASFKGGFCLQEFRVQLEIGFNLIYSGSSHQVLLTA